MSIIQTGLYDQRRWFMVYRNISPPIQKFGFEGVTKNIHVWTHIEWHLIFKVCINNEIGQAIGL